jgi:hypothetical protein
LREVRSVVEERIKRMEATYASKLQGVEDRLEVEVSEIRR